MPTLTKPSKEQKEEVLKTIQQIKEDQDSYSTLKWLSDNYETILALKNDFVTSQNYEKAAMVRDFEKIFHQTKKQLPENLIEPMNFTKEEIASIINSCTKYTIKVNVPVASKYAEDSLKLNAETIGILQFLNLLDNFKSNKK